MRTALILAAIAVTAVAITIGWSCLVVAAWADRHDDWQADIDDEAA